MDDGYVTYVNTSSTCNKDGENPVLGNLSNGTPGRSIEHVESNARLGLDDFIWTWILQIPPKKGTHHVSGYMEGLGISYFNIGLFQTWHHFASWHCHFGGIPGFWAISSWQGKTRYWKDVLISSRHFLCVFSWKLPCQIIHHGIRKPPTKTEVVMGKSWKVIRKQKKSSHLWWSAHCHGILQVFGCQCWWTQQVRGERSVAQLQPKRTALGNQGLENQLQMVGDVSVARLLDCQRFVVVWYVFGYFGETLLHLF